MQLTARAVEPLDNDAARTAMLDHIGEIEGRIRASSISRT
jgi:hypothetical protein